MSRRRCVLLGAMAFLCGVGLASAQATCDRACLRTITLPLMGIFIFEEKEGKMALVAERIYFDNETVLAQLRGELGRDSVFDLSKYEDHL